MDDRNEYQRTYYKKNRSKWYDSNKKYLDNLKKNPIKWDRHIRKRNSNYTKKMYLENLFVEIPDPPRDRRAYYQQQRNRWINLSMKTYYENKLKRLEQAGTYLKPKPYLVRTHKEITLSFD